VEDERVSLFPEHLDTLGKIRIAQELGLEVNNSWRVVERDHLDNLVVEALGVDLKNIGNPTQLIVDHAERNTIDELHAQHSIELGDLRPRLFQNLPVEGSYAAEVLRKCRFDSSN